MKTKTLNVVCKDQEQIDRLNKFKSEDSDALYRIINTGYHEGQSDGQIVGMALGGLALLGAAGTCKIINLIKK